VFYNNNREGFIGAFFSTMIFAFFLSFYLNNPYMTNSLRCIMNGEKCYTNSIFILKEYELPNILLDFLGILRRLLLVFWDIDEVKKTVWIYPVQLHSLVLAAFASLIAPFGNFSLNIGGFFASGVKRAFKMKDFGEVIPGHGGWTDRFDCQFLMGFFSNIYFSTFIASKSVGVGSILQSIIGGMPPEQILEVYTKLGEYLHGQNLI
jgi:phosphatidate cytidylyltransferase